MAKAVAIRRSAKDRDVVARVHLGPRVNAYPYDRVGDERIGRAVKVVGLALGRLPARS